MNQPPPLAYYLSEALSHDYFVPLIVTSMTKGKFKSMNLPFGLGKTTLALWISYVLHGKDWDKTFADLTYYPSEMVDILVPNKDGLEKRPAVVADDLQLTCPADVSVPRVVRRLAGYLSTNRPEVSVLIMTAPNISSIAAPLRRLVAFELIVWERGHYEVQQIVYHKNFRNPLQDLMNLQFVEGKSGDGEDATTFDPLPTEILQRYNTWRAEKKAPYAAELKKELLNYERKRGMEEAPTEAKVKEAAQIMVAARRAKRRAV